MASQAQKHLVILFDLDGTLTDPFEGITRSVRFALEELGRSAPPAGELAWCIGPPLLQSFERLLAEQGYKTNERRTDVAIETEAKEALRLYRERFADIGMLENQVYDGIPGVLEELTDAGYRLFLATSKPRVFAKPILEHFDLARWFQGIYGSELDGTRSNKGDLLEFILLSEGILPEQATMVGDRKHDVEGARRVGLKVLAVSYGYAEPGELKAAKPDAVVESPVDLLAGLETLFNRSQA
ncbi:HAD family hydrolase [Pelagibius sp. Alg239-R121]|uniref:HAD family hydrolase n=1 Tax=Pelagibius sp. Alg239-R121 TaxID=2993448 RepID=UPI0024A69004|nr:HAD family hydrolase [Pelagibius sp. Alg239-R121]